MSKTSYLALSRWTLVVSSFICEMARSRVARFLLVGGYNTIFAYLLFVGLYYWLGHMLHYSIVLLISYIIAVTNSYLLQRRFVFSSRSGGVAQFFRFNVVSISGLFVNMTLLWMTVNWISANIAIAQALAQVGTTVLMYFGHSRFSFEAVHQED